MAQSQVARLDDNALAVVDFGDDAGAGFEHVRLEEQTTPFLRMAQGLSPEINPGKGEYIRGLSLGDIFNTASREVYRGSEGLECVFCFRDYHYGSWIPRDLGGGYRGAISPEDPLVREVQTRMLQKYGSSGRFKMPRYRDGRWTDEPARTRDTNEAVELIETGQLYLLYSQGVLTADTAQRAIIAFTSTALPVYNRYVTRHNNALWPQPSGRRAPAPIWAYKWHLVTFQDKNSKGEYFNWKLELAPQGASFMEALYARDEPELFQMARDFHYLAKSGGVTPADPTAGMPEVGAGIDDEIPF